MGKYEYPEGLSLEGTRNINLFRIANELAEANRLKRLELQLTHKTSGIYPFNTENINKKLEDQA